MKRIALAMALAFGTQLAPAQQTVKMASLVELSGPGTTSGTNFRNGIDLAVKEINAAGGILGRKIVMETNDTQSNPAVAKALTVKAIDNDVYVVMGPVFSGSIIVSMAETRRAEVPNFTGGEAAAITLQGNPYVFRTSFSQATGMPKIANYIASGLKAKSVVVMFVNNDFGKGGRDQIIKEFGTRNIKVVADISTDPAQVDFSSPVLRAKQANADALFAYLNEEESARLLRELRKQGYDKPIVGETTIMGQKVIELAGDAANGVKGHVGLTIDAPIAAIRAFSAKYEREFKSKTDHNGIKGYTGMYVVKAVTEKIGKFDRKAFAAVMKNACFSAKQYPGVLMDLCFDDKGDIDRESFLVEVKNGQQVVVETLPPLTKR
ncbi:MAG: amino acid ABC transporter substrate-binding protein [Betaproteobacteria bacterium]|nr:amino acid ABC transporter substrate-binding protein [Betaproteobacteria bacterium]